ncbi:TPA: hypothetical protein RCG84_000421 [Enterobacter roggenkampii]|uniref:hypothetical protein n=1 Tax=Enterobacter sp. CPE_E1241 TaxID=3376801 RepID=UPI0027E9A0FE|nr:hypothetical protein [Enterobacter roggenkampii]
MTTKQNAQTLAAVAHALIAKLPRMTLAAAVAEWNAVAGKFEIIGVPGRKAHLERLLTALVADIESEAAKALEMDAQHDENNAFAAMWIAQDSRLIDCLINPTLVEADHAEALQWNAFIDYCWPLEVEDVMVGIEITAHEENNRFNWLANRWGLFHASIKWVQVEMLNAAHGEAIAFNREHTAALVALSCDGFRSRWGTHAPHHEAMSVIYCHEQALQMNSAFDNDSIAQFKKVAPAIVHNVKARITGSERDEALMKIIHEEIAHHFAGWQRFFTQYVNFTEDQRREFSGIMYDLVAPLSQGLKGSVNPIYENFVKTTGKTGALNFITHHSSVGGLA